MINIPSVEIIFPLFAPHRLQYIGSAIPQLRRSISYLQTPDFIFHAKKFQQASITTFPQSGYPIVLAIGDLCLFKFLRSLLTKMWAFTVTGKMTQVAGLVAKIARWAEGHL